MLCYNWRSVLWYLLIANTGSNSVTSKGFLSSRSLSGTSHDEISWLCISMWEEIKPSHINAINRQTLYEVTLTFASFSLSLPLFSSGFRPSWTRWRPSRRRKGSSSIWIRSGWPVFALGAKSIASSKVNRSNYQLNCCLAFKFRNYDKTTSDLYYLTTTLVTKLFKGPIRDGLCKRCCPANLEQHDFHHQSWFYMIRMKWIYLIAISTSLHLN